jgi:hypothetical protein
MQSLISNLMSATMPAAAASEDAIFALAPQASWQQIGTFTNT